MATGQKARTTVRYAVAGQEVEAHEVADLIRRDNNRAALSVVIEAPPPAVGPGFVPASVAVAFGWLDMARVFDAKLRADQPDLEALPDEILLPDPGRRLSSRAAMVRQCMEEFRDRVGTLLRDALGRAVEDSYSAAHLTLRGRSAGEHTITGNPDALLSPDAKAFRDYALKRSEERGRGIHPVSRRQGGGRRRGSRKPLEGWEAKALEMFRRSPDYDDAPEQAALAVQNSTDREGKPLFPRLLGTTYPLRALRRIEARAASVDKD